MYKRQITDNLGRAAGNGHRLLEYLYEHPIVSVGEVQKLTRTSFTSANSLVSKLVTSGVLEEVTGQARNRRFIYRSYIQLFNAPEPEQRLSPRRPADSGREGSRTGSSFEDGAEIRRP